jgi:hypothetical protein
MNKAKPISVTFQEPNLFKKILIGGLLNIIPVASLAVLGYFVRAARYIAAGSKRPLPEWNEFYSFWREGFKVWLASLPYFIPAILVSAMNSSIFWRQIPALIQAWQTQIPIYLEYVPPDLRAAEALLWFVGLLCVMPAFLRYLETDKIKVFWQPVANFSYFSQRIGTVWELTGLTVIWLIVGAIGVFIFGVGIILTGGFAYLVLAYLFGKSLLESPVVVDETLLNYVLPIKKDDAGEAAEQESKDVIDWSGLRILTWVVGVFAIVLLAMMFR